MQPFTSPVASTGGYHHGNWRGDMGKSVGINVALAEGLERMTAELGTVGAGKLKMDTVRGWQVGLVVLVEQGAALIGKTEADYANLLKTVTDIGPQNVAADKHHYQL